MACYLEIIFFCTSGFVDTLAYLFFIVLLSVLKINLASLQLILFSVICDYFLNLLYVGFHFCVIVLNKYLRLWILKSLNTVGVQQWWPASLSVITNSP